MKNNTLIQWSWALLIQNPFKNEKKYEYIPIYEPLAGVLFGHLEKITPDKGPAS